MTVFLVDTIMIPSDGSYTRKLLSKDEFVNLVKEASMSGSLASLIQSPVITEHIEELTGTRVPVSREEMVLIDSDLMLICQHAPLVNPAERGQLRLNSEHFVYISIRYNHQATRPVVEPIPEISEVGKQQVRNEIISELLAILEGGSVPIEKVLFRQRLNEWIRKQLIVGEQSYTIDELIVVSFPGLGKNWKRNRKSKGGFDEKLYRLAQSMLRGFTPWELVNRGGSRTRTQLTLRK